jgi:hypothetical protein
VFTTGRVLYAPPVVKSNDGLNTRMRGPGSSRLSTCTYSMFMSKLKIGEYAPVSSSAIATTT